MDLGTRAARIGALADPTRRALYEYVCAQTRPVSREQAAHALDLALHKASFHLDRLADEGLLAVDFRRLSGRSGPGAGRPSKLYRRSDREVAVSLPQRRYDLAADILAEAITRAGGGEPLAEAVEATARDTGRAQARAARAGSTGEATLADLADLLAEYGFEARVDGTTVVLGNCPFHDLAQKHTALVCGVNRSYVQGLADGLGRTDITACPDPDRGNCCVKACAARGPEHTPAPPSTGAR